MATIDDIINGSFSALGAKPAYMSPAYNPADYASIYAPSSLPPSQTFQSGMTKRGLPANYQSQMNNWAVENALRGATPVRIALDANGQKVNPIGYSPVQANPAVTAATTLGNGQSPVGATVTALDQSAYDARNKPGTWMALSRQLAQVGMRQKAFQQANGMTPAGPALAAPAKGGGLASLITGKGTPRTSGGLFGLLFGGGASKPAAAPYGGRYTPQQLADREAQGQAIAQANRQNPNPTYTVSGDNNSFMPRSVQESARWQTGY